MIDTIDVASQNEEDFRQYLIKNHRDKPLPLIGRCYNCDDPTKGNFCCMECGEDWEKRKYFKSQKIKE
ncbi:hypothetical protein [Sodalis-like secondary symbiont of Drepanosiphum platanoidis]|uniref:hypothetical protein n=1 Tax=Sodalis-like secondary symbiont of Drepanosiphum platanoidis TaxID=2994493 RepID=UPI003463C9F2